MRSKQYPPPVRIDPYRITRRQFVQTATTGAAALLSCPDVFAAADPTPSRTFEHGKPLYEFGYGDVHLAEGAQETQLQQTHQILMGLDEDSLLRPFRLASGLPAPGRDLGGWYGDVMGVNDNSERQPSSFGQWISALSRYYAITGDQHTRAKVERLVDAFAKVVEPTGQVFSAWKRPPPYFYNMLTRGLLDAHRFARNPTALDVLERLTDAVASRLPPHATDNDAGGWSLMMPEEQFIAWEHTGQTRHLDLAKRHLLDTYFDPLARGENVLGGRHAYAHVDSLSGAAKAYLVLGEPKYLEAAINGLAFVEQQSFVTGGWGPLEGFLPKPAIDYTIPETGEKKHLPAVETLGDSILQDHHQFETGCGSYAHFKLTRYLLRITQNPHYGDSMERVMYNAALGMLPLNRFGKAFYQSNYHARARKEYFDGYGNLIEDEWPCCSGTLPQLAADYRISTYFRGAAGVFVNLYIPSTLRWSQNGADITLKQAGDYPLSDSIGFSVETSRPSTFTLKFRIPAWAQMPGIRINDTVVKQRVQPGTFSAIQRKWRSGDKIKLTLPKRLELKPADDKHPDLVALCCGPMVLFAIGDELPKLDRQTLLGATQSSHGGAEWHSGDVRFLPWWHIKDEIYTTYHDVA